MWVISGSENVFEMRIATLNGLFYNAPLVFLFIIPAITMRTFAEEKRTGTIELLYTKPLKDIEILLAKYLSGFFIIFISLLPTWIYYMSVDYIADPAGAGIDIGGTIGGYIGLYLIAAIFLAIGIFCSSCTKNQVVSFLMALTLSFFFYKGFDAIGTFSWWGSWDGTIQSLGISAHYQSLQKGVLDTRDLTYFISLSLIFLALTHLILKSRRW